LSPAEKHSEDVKRGCALLSEWSNHHLLSLGGLLYATHVSLFYLYSQKIMIFMEQIPFFFYFKLEILQKCDILGI